MTVIKTRLFVVALVCFFLLIFLVPIQTTIVPEWRFQVVDVGGSACPNMRVTQSWGHYSLYLDGNHSSDDRLTDASGYVKFPARAVRASLPRRIVMPLITRVTTIMHGGWGIHAVVWASGIKDVAWLSYQFGKPLPDAMRVEQCIDNKAEPDR